MSTQREPDDSTDDTGGETVVVRAYDVLKCHMVPGLPRWLNPSYMRLKRTIDSRLAASSILTSKRAADYVKQFDFLTNITTTETVIEADRGKYEYGQTFTFEFDTTECDSPTECARWLAQRMTDAPNIEVEK